MITTIALASSNQSKKNAIQECQAELSDSTPSCSVNPTKDLPQNEPVYLRHDGKSYHLWYPSASVLKWNTTSEETALLCSGANNVLEQTNKPLNVKTCSKGQEFLVEGATTAISAKDLKCKASVDGECAPNVEPCANNRGVLNKLGFNAGTGGFITYIDSCFDADRSSVLYTRHILPGAAIANAVVADAYQTWRTDGIDAKIDPDALYTQTTQFERFEALLGSKAQAEKYIEPGRTFLNRGHLTPRGDGIFQTWKHATFFYTNAIPQWNVINEGNWNNIEQRVRIVASLLQEDVLVIQGSFGVLSLPNDANQSIAISLSAAGLDVPLWMWKILKSPSKNAGIAFVTLNNPYETKKPDELLCTNVCERYGWTEQDYNNFTAGFTYCCDPNDLVRMVPHIPYEGLVKEVLTPSMLSSSAKRLSAWYHLILVVGLVHLLRMV
ncbi:AAEL008857-PA [Aedes aegypti]|uniref:AAEL008857-PA n=1 Tax=Aedes aegypti TaxID=7159 RepID=Q16XJ3_AEDAE|nr:AAEL008857-PA [Aedes aegypti]